MSVSLNLSSFCLLVGFPLQHLLVALCDGIKLEMKKLRHSVIIGLSSSDFSLGRGPIGHAASALEFGWVDG